MTGVQTCALPIFESKSTECKTMLSDLKDMKKEYKELTKKIEEKKKELGEYGNIFLKQ